jgi:short-subunit dehydrogenase
MRIEPGTRAIVTGASRGIGRATAIELAKRGARVGLVARGAEELERLAAEIGEAAVPLQADAADRASVDAAVESFVAETGGLELAVANAGRAHYAPFADQPIEHAEEMVAVNVMGTIYTVHAALERMLPRARGHIVVVSSAAGLRAFPSAAVYGATKAADRGFAEALRHELSGTGVSVSTVYPGEIDTDLHAHELDKMPDWRHGDEAIAPEQVAAAIVRGVEEDRRDVFVPSAVRFLGLNGLAPRLLDRVLTRMRGPTVAPRRD